MTASPKRSGKIVLKVAAISTITYFLAFWTPIIVLKGNRLANVLYSLIYSIPVFAVFISCLWACRNSKSYRRLLGLVVLGMTLWMLGVITISFCVIPRRPANIPSPNLADIFSLAYQPIMLAIIISLGKIRFPLEFPLDAEKKRFLVSIAVISLTMLLLLYKFIPIPSWYLKPISALIFKSQI